MPSLTDNEITILFALIIALGTALFIWLDYATRPARDAIRTMFRCHNRLQEYIESHCPPRNR